SVPSVLGPPMQMLLNATSIKWINQQERKGRQGEKDERSRSVLTGSRPRRGGAKGRRAVDASPRQRTAPLAGKRSGRRSPTQRICASGLPLKPIEAWGRLEPR